MSTSAEILERSVIRWVLRIILIFSFLPGIAAPSQERARNLWVVSIPQLSLAPEERVVSFEVMLRSARTVTFIPQVPFQWLVCIDNSAGAPRVRGDSIVGAANLESFFKDLLVIEKLESPHPSFAIQVEISIVTVDFTKSRRVTFGEKDLVFRKKEVEE